MAVTVKLTSGKGSLMLYSIRKDKLKQAGFFYLFYFLAMLLGVLVGLLFDRSGNMFYAPAFTAFFGGVLFIFYTEKIKTFGLISGLGCLLGLCLADMALEPFYQV